jgi:hypothetical protein
VTSTIPPAGLRAATPTGGSLRNINQNVIYRNPASRMRDEQDVLHISRVKKVPVSMPSLAPDVFGDVEAIGSSMIVLIDLPSSPAMSPRGAVCRRQKTPEAGNVH